MKKNSSSAMRPYIFMCGPISTPVAISISTGDNSKKYDKRRNGKSTRGQIKNRASIDDRPSIVDEKSRIGDWEIDTVIGKGHSGALVAIVMRVTKHTVSAQVNSKSA